LHREPALDDGAVCTPGDDPARIDRLYPGRREAERLRGLFEDKPAAGRVRIGCHFQHLVTGGGGDDARAAQEGAALIRDAWQALRDQVPGTPLSRNEEVFGTELRRLRTERRGTADREGCQPSCQPPSAVIMSAGR
jgi:hypothetical protein